MMNQHLNWRRWMFSFVGNAVNDVVDKFVDWIIPLDNFGPLTDEDEVSW